MIKNHIIEYEHYCCDCQHGANSTWRKQNISSLDCPSCGSSDVCINKLTICKCGTTVYLSGGYSVECESCSTEYVCFLNSQAISKLKRRIKVSARNY